MQIGQPHQFLSIVAVLFDGPLVGLHSEALTALIWCIWRCTDIQKLYIFIQVQHKSSQHIWIQKSWTFPCLFFCFASLFVWMPFEWKPIAKYLHICWKTFTIKRLNILDIIARSLDLDYKSLFSSCVHILIKMHQFIFIQLNREQNWISSLYLWNIMFVISIFI